MASRQYPTAEYLNQALEYRDGKLFWKTRPRCHFATDEIMDTMNKTYAGTEAGSCDKDPARPRWGMCINYKSMRRHQVVWIMHGNELTGQLDHINRDFTDDRIENLRLATGFQNAQNKSLAAVNTSGYKGVSWDKRRLKWEAAIECNKKRYRLGRFDDIKEAADAYKAKAEELHGQFACTTSNQRSLR